MKNTDLNLVKRSGSKIYVREMFLRICAGKYSANSLKNEDVVPAALKAFANLIGFAREFNTLKKANFEIYNAMWKSFDAEVSIIDSLAYELENPLIWESNTASDLSEDLMFNLEKMLADFPIAISSNFYWGNSEGDAASFGIWMK